MNDEKITMKRSEHIELRLFGASEINGVTPPTLTLTISERIQDSKKNGELRRIYQNQGQVLAGCLFCALPGGTIDALLVELMSRRASLLSVPLNPGVSGW